MLSDRLKLKFQKLNETIPYCKGGKVKFLSATIYTGVSIAQPGRHADETNGGDAVVMVSDEQMDWTNHQFTHDDIFKDIEFKNAVDPTRTAQLMEYYIAVIKGASPAKYDLERESLPGVHPQTFLYAVQVLGVIEHRRYARFEPQFGGRYLPFRFSAGIAEGLWDADAAIGMQKKGRPGCEILEKFNGLPKLTKELMGK